MTPPPPVPELTVSPTSHAYGTLPIGAHSSQAFEVKNDGTAELIVTATALAGANADEFEITSGGGNFTLAPDSTREVTVRFEPLTPGMKNAALRFVTSDASAAPVDAALTGTGGDQVVLTLDAIKDNTLYQDATGALSNGVGSSVFVGRTAGGVGFPPLTRRALLAFPVEDLVPTGTTIDSVALRLHMSQTATGMQTIVMHRLRFGWGEGTSNAQGGGGGGGAPSTRGDATWVHRFYPDSLWQNDGSDYDNFPSATIIVEAPGFYTWSGAGLRADVQSWIDGSQQNHGWVLIGNESGAKTAKRFDSRENSDKSVRPVLLVYYTPPAKTMTP
jgi:hypothetical protein